MQGGLFNPSGGVLAPMAADSTTAIQLCRHNGTTCDVTYDSTNGNVGIGTTSPSAASMLQDVISWWLRDRCRKPMLGSRR